MPSENACEPPRRLRVISGLGLFEILTWGSSFYLLAVLAAPIVEDTGWSLAAVVGALSGGLILAGLVSPTIGRLIGRHGGRPVLAGATLALASGSLLLALSPNLTVFYAGWVLIGVGMAAGLYDAAFATLGRLYGLSGRSAITTLTLWGGFASTVCWPLSAYLVDQLGWRGTCLAYAAIHIGITLPLVLFTLPREEPRISDAGTRNARSRDRRAPLPLLVLLGAIGVAMGTISAAMSVHVLTILQDRGLTLAAAVGLGALIGPAQVAARVIEMAGRGRHHPLWTLTAATVLVTLGIGLLCWQTAGTALALVLYGGGNGLNSIAKGTVPLALFGPERYPEIIGALALPQMLAQALSPSLFALALSAHGTRATLALALVIAAASVAMVGGLWLHVRRRGADH